LYATVTHAQTSTLIATGSVWKYMDDGSDPGTAWRAFLFDDSEWPSGPAELGFGDGDERTIVRSNRLDGTRIITTYFRHAFNVADASVYSNLVVRLRRDDGGIVYLNAVEIFRSNMPTGAVTYLTRTAGATGSETALLQQGVNPALLQSGPNILAVEIHQQDTNSTDMSFELALEANVPGGPPTVAITSPMQGAAFPPANVTLTATATDADGSVTLVEFFDGATLIGQDSTTPYSVIWSNPAAGPHVLTARAWDNLGSASVSAPLNITVLAGTVVVFRQGLNGYTGTQDTQLQENAPNNDLGATNFIVLDTDLVTGGGLDAAQGLLRFDNVVGPATNQVPPGVTVVRATLTLQTDDPSDNAVNLHRMLIPWSEASTWASLGAGISADGLEAQATPDTTFTNNVDETTTSIDVTARVQAWVNGDTNLGWALLPTGNNGYRFDSSEAGTAANRPALTVTYTASSTAGLRVQLVGLDPVQIRLSWDDAAGFVLEETTDVTGLTDDWETSLNQVNPQTLTPSGGTFYRLRRP
jgi:hypothetical protein